MKQTILDFGPLALGIAVFTAIFILGILSARDFNHYREACYECDEICFPYRGQSSAFRNPYLGGTRECYCDLTSAQMDSGRLLSRSLAPEM